VFGKIAEKGVNIMIKVIFVCLGNICRSPMAEAIFRKKVKDAGLTARIQIDSAGTGDWHLNHPPHKGTQKILSEHGISCEGMVSRLVTATDLQDCHYIVCMDDSNVINTQTFGDVGEGNFFGKLSDFVPNATWSHVPDPYYTGDFEETYRLVDEGCAYLLAEIREKHRL